MYRKGLRRPRHRIVLGPEGSRTHNLNYILKSNRLTTTAPLNSKRQRQNAVWDQEHEHDGDDWFARRKR